MNLRQWFPELDFKKHSDLKRKKNYIWELINLSLFVFSKYSGSMVILTLLYGFKSIACSGQKILEAQKKHKE